MRFQTTAVVLVVGLASVFSLPIPNAGEAKEIFDFLPEEAKTFYTSLTEQDLQILKELHSQIVGKDCAVACEIIKTRSEDLANRLKTLHDTIMGKINGMSDIPKNFLSNAINKLQADMDMVAQIKNLVEILRAAKELPKESKEEIYRSFPSLKNFFENDKVEQFLNENKNKSPEEIVTILKSKLHHN
ncbi:hypothetical protein QR680_013743 [Steinernema hermaphroditum]|uniref:Fatty-acid and retinol-binding protein 1 n=1 Tax=Steinernema hermaphroditum TaxID=289476 RepID=A0AA39I6I5_9BILA|nr:hypothetical protein QR680_013743 [Steinernema hermaphroditum]